MNGPQGFSTAVLTGVILGIVLEPTLGRWPAIVIAVAVAAAVNAGGRLGPGRSHARDADGDTGPEDDGEGGHGGDAPEDPKPAGSAGDHDPDA